MDRHRQGVAQRLDLRPALLCARQMDDEAFKAHRRYAFRAEISRR
jgi:hypothetical protein